MRENPQNVQEVPSLQEGGTYH